MALRVYERELRFYQDLGDQVAGLSIARAQLVVDAMARFHAQWWESAALDCLDWMPRLDDPMYAATVPGIFHAGWPITRDQWGATLGPAQAPLATRSTPRSRRFSGTAASGRPR